jgi:large subunit ribosomal protein L15
MKLNQLPKTTTNSKKRLGRGFGSGKGGHTSSRGQKGQKSRGRVGLLFEGTKMRKSLIKRLPFLRGKGKFKPSNHKPLIINLKYLELIPANSKVDIQILAKYNLVDASEASKYGVKILGEGKLTKALTVLVPTSRQAAEKIKKAGGKLNLEEVKTKISKKKVKAESIKKRSKPSKAKKVKKA